MEHQDQVSGLRAQLEEITNTLDAKTAECEGLQALIDERSAEKEERRTKKVEEFQSLKDLVQRIVDETEAAKAIAAEERERNAEKPGIDVVLEKLQEQNAEQKTVLQDMASGWLKESERLHTETLDTVKATANVQVPYNVQEYLNQFSLALANEVRMLLDEVESFVKKNAASNSCLMCMRSKYGPGGEFDPDWKPVVPPYVPGDGGPPPPGGGPPPPGGPLPPEPVIPPAKPAWRNVHPPQPPKASAKGSEEAAAAAGPSGGPD
ncbi:hypothetical protein JB92DRAFT_1651432 [Gautieria morchelliformis]|nr:hypothetical protein JB92DRAFT_1651432 [Gautieria morchelliformis]